MERLTIDIVLFDLDGVLRNWDSQLEDYQTGGCPIPIDDVREAAFDPSLLHPAITGRMTDDAWRAGIVARLAERYSDELAQQAVTAWSASPGLIDPVILEMVHALRTVTPVGLLTNATDRLPRDLDQLNVGSAFDHIFNSSAIGHAKPDRAIFARVTEALAMPADRVLFIDDSPGHVRAARQFGWKAFHYRGIEPLLDDLAAFDLPQRPITS